MRLFDYIYENLVKDALDIDEPEVGGRYSDDYVTKIVDKLKSAISQAEKDSYVDDDSKEAVISDLEDKLDAWENVDKETKPAPPPKKDTPEEDAEQGEEEDERDAKEKDKEKESEKRREENNKEREKNKEDDEDKEDKEEIIKKKKTVKTESRLIKSRIKVR